MNTSLEQRSRGNGRGAGPGWACPVLLVLAVFGLTILSAAVIEPVLGPDLVLWLDARDITGQGTAPGKSVGGGPLNTWADKSTYHNDARQTVPSQQPVSVCEAADGGVQAVRFQAARRQHLASPLRDESGPLRRGWP